MNYQGVIIEESLADKSVLKEVKIISTEIEPVTERMQSSEKQWTLHTVEVPFEKAKEFAEQIRKSLSQKDHWYADYKTDSDHYIIYRDKIFHITDRKSQAQYDEASRYGISVGIPAHQVDFKALSKD